MGDILFLAHRLPYPPDRGDRIRSWHILQALARLAPVHVCALIDGASDRAHVPMVESIARSVNVVERTCPHSVAVMRALLRGTPASVELFRSASLRRVVADVLAANDIDCVYAFSGQMADYVPLRSERRLVMDFVDVDSAKFEHLGGFARRREGARLRRWEAAVAARADVSVFVSHAEASLFRTRSGMQGQVVENGVDLRHFVPQPDVQLDDDLVVFTGQMDYAPNVEAVIGFARDILPRLPTARFAIVGRNPVSAVRALAGDRVIVTGEVNDVRPWLARAALVVAPLRVARGVQNKVLEAMAMGKAVVASPQAARGIDAVPGRDFFVTSDLAAVVQELLLDPQRAADTGSFARARIVDRYDWTRVLAPLAGIVRG